MTVSYTLALVADASRQFVKWALFSTIGADPNATYVLQSADAALPNSFVATAGSGITLTPAGGNLTIAATATAAPSWIYGDGSDGAATCDGSATPAGTSKSGSDYTLTRDVYWSSLAMSTGTTLKTAGFRAFVNGTGTLTGTAHIHADGFAAAGGAPGAGGGWDIQNAVPGAGATLGGGRGGANGGSTLSTIINSMGGAGGAGDSGGPFGVTRPVTSLGSPHEIIAATRGWLAGVNSSSGGAVTAQGPTILVGGNGGGGGANGGANGDGGGGGGVVVVCIKTLAGAGKISADGGAGQAGAPNCGGGGGGGFVVWVTRDTTGWSGTVTAAGGAGSGNTSTAGSAGTVIGFTA